MPTWARRSKTPQNVCVCVCACVRACVRACVCVRASAFVWPCYTHLLSGKPQDSSVQTLLPQSPAVHVHVQSFLYLTSLPSLFLSSSVLETWPPACTVNVCWQELAECSYMVTRRSTIEQLLDEELRKPNSHSVFYRGHCLTFHTSVV